MCPDRFQKIFSYCRWIAIAFGCIILFYVVAAHAWIDIELNAPELIQMRHEIDEHDRQEREQKAREAVQRELNKLEVAITQEQIRQFIDDMSKARYSTYENMNEQDRAGSSCYEGTTLDKGHD